MLRRRSECKVLDGDGDGSEEGDDEAVKSVAISSPAKDAFNLLAEHGNHVSKHNAYERT